MPHAAELRPRTRLDCLVRPGRARCDAARRRQGREPGRTDPGGNPRPARIRRHHLRLPRLSAGNGARSPHRRADRGVERRGRRGAARHRLPGTGGDRGSADAGRPARANRSRLPRAGRGAGRGALVGDRRRPRRSLVRRAAVYLPQHRGRGGSGRRGAALLGLALRGARDLLPRERRLGPQRGRSRRAGAADGAVAGVGRDVHDRPDFQRPGAGRDRGRVRAGRGRRIGPGQPRSL